MSSNLHFQSVSSSHFKKQDYELTCNDLLTYTTPNNALKSQVKCVTCFTAKASGKCVMERSFSTIKVLNRA